MTTRPRAFALTVTLGCLAPGLPAKGDEGSRKAPEPPRTFEVAAVDAYVEAVVRHQGFPGIALTVVRGGKVVLSKGYGKRSLDDGSPVEARTAFAAGSVTKQVACACVLMLADEGKLSVEDKVSKYYPELTKAGEITLYQLMTHTSGYPDYYPLDFVDRRLLKPAKVDDLIREYAGGKLDFEPGARWSYSNTGYLVLGRVVEKVSGETFGAFLKRRVFDPVGMADSSFEPGPGVEGRARGYISFALGPPEPAEPERAGWLYAAGGLWASTPDLARWDLALMDGRLLKPGSFRLMTTPVVLNDGKARDYGCGLTVRRDGGETVFSHGGAVSGFRAYNAMVPRTKSALAILTNDEQSDASLAETILGLLLQAGETPEAPKVDGPPARVAALEFFRRMQNGEVDRGSLGEEFSVYLTAEKVRAAAPRLKAYGEPDKVEISPLRERGGMEVATVRFTFKSGVLKGVLYRSPDGKVQQLLFERE